MYYYGLSDKGQKRKKNEDCFAAERVAENAYLFLVCDGMGGEAGGEIASTLAAGSFINDFMLQTAGRMRQGRLFLAEPEAEARALLDSAASAANFEVREAAAGERTLEGMGTTLVAALVLTDPLRVFSLNIGDSRLYLINDEKITRLTKDHSYIQLLLDNGDITPEEAEKRTDRNIITRAIGISVRCEPDIAEVAVTADDYLLLCSDGLYGMLGDDELHGVAALDGVTAEEKIGKLVALANDAGGDDNITALLVSLK